MVLARNDLATKNDCLFQKLGYVKDNSGKILGGYETIIC